MDDLPSWWLEPLADKPEFETIPGATVHRFRSLDQAAPSACGQAIRPRRCLTSPGEGLKFCEPCKDGDPHAEYYGWTSTG